MSSTSKAVVMLAVLVGGPAAWMHYRPLPPAAQRYVDDALAAAQDFLAEHGVLRRSSPPSEGAGPAAAEFALENQWATTPAISSTPAGTRPAAYLEAPPLVATEQTPSAPTKGALEPLLAELVKLGVGEYELMRWGTGGELYRFRCAVPLAGDMSQAQEFEAIGPTPQAPIAQVLEDLSSWHVARNETGLMR